jgi:hypothetical protein
MERMEFRDVSAGKETGHAFIINTYIGGIGPNKGRLRIQISIDFHKHAAPHGHAEKEIGAQAQGQGADGSASMRKHTKQR